MPLVRCSDCDAHVSSRAKVCPRCGRPLTRPSVRSWLVLGCLGLLLFAPFLAMLFEGITGNRRLKLGNVANTRTTTTLSVDEKRLGAEPIYCPGAGIKGQGLFTDPVPCAVELYLGPRLNDPASFQSDGCNVTAGEDAWIADCRFRAKNRFGGMVLQRYKFWIRNNQLLRAEELG
jgi:hypothetical protein